MSSPEATPRTALATQVAAEGPLSFAQMERAAASIAKSGLFGMKTPEQALALMLISQAEGRPAALAALDYHVVSGKPTLKADTMLSRFQAAGGSVKWHTYTDDKVAATFTHPQGGSVMVDWTLERAKKVQVWNKDASKWESLTEKITWRNFARAMLRARVISEGVRTCYPGVAVGIYTPQEIQDGATEFDVTPATLDEAVQATADARHALSEAERKEHLDEIAASRDSQALIAAFSAAWKHGKESKDTQAQGLFKEAYEAHKVALSAPKADPKQEGAQS